MLSRQAVWHQAKQLGLGDGLIERVGVAPYFDPIKEDLSSLLDPGSFVDRALEQVERCIEEWVRPTLDDDGSRAGIEGGAKAESTV